MKVAIITLPMRHNYGGIMQAYALSKYIQSCGHECEVLDFQFEKHGFWKYLQLIAGRSVKKLFGKRKASVVMESHYPKIFAGTLGFIQKNIPMSPPVHEGFDIDDYLIENNFELLIVGSDQVWRKEYISNISRYFLNFGQKIKCKKASYAASFGVNSWVYNSDETNEITSLLAKFDHVSVREQAGVELCKKHLNTEAVWVCDPTLLLSKADYQKFTGQSSESTGIFSYVLDSTDFKKEMIDFVAHQTGDEILTCYPKRNRLDVQGVDINDYVFPDVEEWLSRFNDCKLVITDSYHGVIFSIIFNKPYLVFVNEDRGASRFESLLSVLDFSDRIVNDLGDVQKIIDDGHLYIPKDSVTMLNYIDKSKTFLGRVIKK